MDTTDDEAVSRSRDYARLKGEYQAMFDACETRPNRQTAAAEVRRRVAAGKARYEAVAAAFGAMPWPFVGAIHAMESGLSFARHLHNGDPLTARTVHVPAGRPKTGAPPFAWEDSAKDALRMRGLGREGDWSIPRMLFNLERYNGWGYRALGKPTPYLWSFSTHYLKGKYVADGRYDGEAVSQQAGAALILKGLL